MGILVDKRCKKCEEIFKDVDKKEFKECKKCGSSDLEIYFGNHIIRTPEIYRPSIIRKGKINNGL